MANLRQWIARKLLMWAYLIDREGKFEFRDGCYKFERGWKQPISPTDTVSPEEAYPFLYRKCP